jgi:hypothetical protein
MTDTTLARRDLGEAQKAYELVRLLLSLLLWVGSLFPL